MADIDAIFASTKSKKSSVLKSSSLPKSTFIPEPTRSSSKKKSKAKKKKGESSKEAPATLSTSDTPPKPTPETIVDPSLALKTAPSSSHPPKQITSRQKRKKTEDAREDFADSRGKSSRRKTDEGWSIYKEDELKISASAGGTYSFLHKFSLHSSCTQTHHCVHLIVNAVFNTLPMKISVSWIPVCSDLFLHLNRLLRSLPGRFRAYDQLRSKGSQNQLLVVLFSQGLLLKEFLFATRGTFLSSTVALCGWTLL